MGIGDKILTNVYKLGKQNFKNNKEQSFTDMVNIENQSCLYLDKQMKEFSNISAGLIIKAIGDGQNIAYIDARGHALKLTNFIENLSLTYSFIKNFRFRLDIYRLNQKDKVSKTLIPIVEFGNIPVEMFWRELLKYDIVIFDNFSLKDINKIKLISFLSNRVNTKVIAITDEQETFDKLEENFNLKVSIEYENNKSLAFKKGLINIYGNGHGKTSYALGYMIRNFVYKKDVKLIYFDKGDDIYGDAIFLGRLKRWSIENNLYGRFDFVKTGIKRHLANQFRETIIQQDIKEAKDALMLLETSLKKHAPVIADELNTVIEKQMVSIDEVIRIINSIHEELVITGTKSPKKIIELSQKIIKFQQV